MNCRQDAHHRRQCSGSQQRVQRGVCLASCLQAFDGSGIARNEGLGSVPTQFREGRIDVRYLLEQTHQFGVAAKSRQVGTVARFEDRIRIVDVADPSHAWVQHVFLRDVENCGEDLLFVVEVGVERAGGAVRFLGDVRETGVEIPCALEHRSSRCDQRSPGTDAAGSHRQVTQKLRRSHGWWRTVFPVLLRFGARGHQLLIRQSRRHLGIGVR